MKLADEVINNFLQYLYDEGYRYLFVVTYTGAAAVSKSKPTFSNEKCLESPPFYTVLSGYAHKLGRLILNDTYYCIDIGKKLNIVDWFTVEVDTKIRVRDYTRIIHGKTVISLFMKMVKYMLTIVEKLRGVQKQVIFQI